ncbi:hypothetical protein HXX76_002394 [Chlamydomonas incerta]|uniref:Protein kinase domain-containing protein n=1 Tax=Chlamydomonas incerta TaxID=51695 RepID=A0A835TF80_CHLIN|nr:hypothetical protein HXX76_002394 [Chlamydomonas incerta]|eukprot:KAG2442308.1 hypothetical protein HXX76_002394 [Chlamydomonas incerta]
MVHLLDECSRSGIVLGDLKAQNMLINAQGEAKLTDPDGACPLLPHHVLAALAASNQVEAAARAACTDPWGWVTIAKAVTAPAMAPPEFWIGWAVQWLEEGAAAGHDLSQDLRDMWLEAQDECKNSAGYLLDRLQRECGTHAAALQLLHDMGGGCDCSYMCGASHQYLLGASMSDLLWSVAAVLGQQQGEESEQRLAFVSELHGVMARLMTGEPASRPSLRMLRRWLAGLRADWC